MKNGTLQFWQFENRPLGAAVIDEFGNVYDEDELNKFEKDLDIDK